MGLDKKELRKFLQELAQTTAAAEYQLQKEQYMKTHKTSKHFSLYVSPAQRAILDALTKTMES